MPSAYIETTIPSYYVARPSGSLIQASRQASTRLWWDGGCSGFDLVTSLEAIEEAEQREPEMAAARIALLSRVRRPITEDVGTVASELVRSGLIPSKAASDAIHISVASVHGTDFLVTWNLRHIANPYIRSRLRQAVEDLGFHLPVICSPEELLQYDEDS